MYFNTDTEPYTFRLAKKNNYLQKSGKNIMTSPGPQSKKNLTNIITSPSHLNFNTESTNELKKKLDRVSENSGHKIKLSPPKTGVPEIKSPILMRNFNLPGVNNYINL